MLLNDEKVAPASREKWEEIFNVQIDRQTWEKIYKLLFECTIESLLQSFQYRVIHEMAAYRYLLQKFGYVADNKCEKCNKVETIRSKFFEYVKLKPLWLYIEAIIR